MFANYDFDVIWRSLPYLFYQGMTFTLLLTALATLGGIVIGTLLALMRLSGTAALTLPAAAYVNLMRSVPFVLMIFWFYFLVPYIGQWITRSAQPLQVGAFASCLVTFTLFEAAFFCEIMRAGIQSIPRGQMAAAQALGMTYPTDDGLHRAAAGIPQHGAGAADADHHPVSGYVAGLRASRSPISSAPLPRWRSATADWSRCTRSPQSSISSFRSPPRARWRTCNAASP